MSYLNELISYFQRPILVDENGCWNWCGSISANGYAIFSQQKVHKIVYERCNGPRLPNTVIRHLCSNKRCINPDHLQEGTYSENLIDSVLDDSRGLGTETYRQIYLLHKNGMRQADIARKFNISRSIVSQFLLGQLLCNKPEYFALEEDNAEH